MNLKTTLGLLIAIAAGGALAWFGPSVPFARKHAAPAQNVDQGSQAVLNQLNPSALLSIEVRQGDRVMVLNRGPVMVVAGSGSRKRDDSVPRSKQFAGKKWRLPGGWPVRTAEVNELVDLIGNLRSRFQPERLRAGGQDLARFGLAPPASGSTQPAPITVVVETEAGSHTLVFGESAESGETNRFSRPTYVRVDDRPEVLRLAPGLLTVLDRPTDYYQQRRLFAAERVAKEGSSQDKVERLIATGIVAEERRPAPGDAAVAATGTTLLEHPQAHTTRFGLVVKDQTWETSVPVRDRIDPATRDTLLGAVPDLWAERFVHVDLPAVAAAVAAPEGSLMSAACAAAWLSTTTPSKAADGWLRLKSGLEAPERVLSVTGKDGQTITLLIGKVASVRTQRKTMPGGPPGTPPREEILREEYRYAQLKNNPQVFEIRADKLKDVFVDPANLRDARLARFTTGDARRVEIDQQGKATVLVKDKERWKLEKPIQSDADTEKVNDLLNKLTSLEARKDDIRDVAESAPASKAAALKPFGLDKPAAVVKVTVEEEVKGPGDAKEKKTRVLAFAIGKQDEKAKKLYVKAEDWPRVNFVDNSLLPVVTRPALSYRGNKLFDFSAGDVAGLEIRKGEQKLTLAHEQNKWRLTAPFAAEADETKASQLASSLSGLEVIEYVSDAPPADELEKQYGLGKPPLAVVLSFTDKAKPARTLQIGKARDGKPGFFAKLADSPGVFAVNNDIRNFLDRDALAYLPAELWKVAPEEVTALRVRKGGEPEYRLTRSDKAWKVSSPFEAPALGDAVQAALAQLGAPQAESYKSHDDKELAKVGLDKPVLTLHLTAADGKERGLLIGSPVAADSKSRYAKLTTGPAVFVVGEPVFLAADKSALDWLDPVLAKVDPSRVERIVSRSGDKALTIEKKGSEWRAVQGPGAPFTADEAAVNSLLASWLNLKAEKFAAYGPNLDLARFGLDKPAHSVAVRSSPEGGNSPVEHALDLGQEAPGTPGGHYARLDKGPGVVVLAPGTWNNLARDNLGFVNRTLVKLDPRAVTGIQRRGKGELELVKQDDGWRLVKPASERADDKVLQDLLGQFAELRASRIAAYPAEDPARYGLGDSATVVTIKQAGDKTTKLKLGKATGDNGDRFVLVEGNQAVGVLPGNLARQLAGGPLAFRDRNLVRFPDADTLRLERGPRRAMFARVDGSWKLTEPLAADADQDELDELLNSLAKLRADEFVAEKPAESALAGYGLDRPEVRWRVRAGNKEVLTLNVGNHEKGGQRRYARLGDRDAIFLLDPRLSGKVMGEFRTRAVWSPALDASQVESLHYADARGSFQLEKNSSGTWQVIGKPDLKIIPATVTETLDALAGLKVVHYAMDKDADFKLYGLEPAELTVEIATRSGKRVLYLGRPEGESKSRYARTGEPGHSDVFVLGEADVAKIVRDAVGFTKQPANVKK